MNNACLPMCFKAWEAWLRRQGLSRLLRHDSRRFLRMDGLNLLAARAETCDFRVKGMADGQVELEDEMVEAENSPKGFLRFFLGKQEFVEMRLPSTISCECQVDVEL